ncbi:hypothetical protein D1BOALGB6SA_1059 [Olavius sp. associated proteobacterium Delta 1]|nr:hypothetical protein D1BOALGB6SA_1059 [Olavius sp. associated proteobacterium Delta 1]
MIFLAFAPFVLKPLPLCHFLLFLFRCFTIWVPAVFGIGCCRTQLIPETQIVSQFKNSVY